jgi:hypothetical protein
LFVSYPVCLVFLSQLSIIIDSFSFSKQDNVMATHYIENAASGNQYYFDDNSAATAQAQRPAQDRAYPASVSTAAVPAIPVGSSEYSSYPAGGVSGVRYQPQTVRTDRNVYNEGDVQQWPQQHQSVAGFNKTVAQQQLQSASSPTSVPQVRATVRTAASQEQQIVSPGQYQQSTVAQRSPQTQAHFERTSSPQAAQISPHQQFDSRQSSGHSMGAPVYYPSANAAQHTHPELEQRTDSPSRGREQHAQVNKSMSQF